MVGRNRKNKTDRPRENRQARTDRRQDSSSTEGALLIGRNPISEALASDREVMKLLVQRGVKGPALKLVSQARKKAIPVQFVDKARLEKLADGGAHQGVIAFVSDFSYSSIEEILQAAENKGQEPFLILCDGIEDPHNLGAIIRTAECAGANGVVIPKRRSASVNETVEKTSAGASSYMPVARVTNIKDTIEELKQKGLWIACCDMGGQVYCQRDLKGPIALVVGSEGFGVGRSVKEACDFVLSIPMKGQINSLNASNAAAILMYEIRRQRDASELEK